MKRKTWVILALLVVAILVLGGCGVPPGGVDVSTTPPEGLWQTLVVWPLANALIWLDSKLAAAGVPYHWGFAIILFTIGVKILTFPLTYKQLQGMQAQRAMQPRIQELQKKYGSDRNRLAQEQMKVYQEAGVNPLSGCLPLVIQMPILFGLYAALVAIGPNLENAAFFWIPDLSFPNATVGMSWIMEDVRAGNIGHLITYLVLPILLMVTQFVMQKWMTPAPTSDDPQVKTTQQITLVMTFMFGFFTLQVPAGLTLYWVTSNLLQMAQQWYMMSRTTLMTAPASAIAGSSAASRTTVEGTASASNGAKSSSKPSTVKATTKPTTVKSSAARSGDDSKRKGSK
ncbi:MAG: YidC/Oxa1 family membrane protein insertase [Caldilineaceae bacterium]